MNAILTQKIGMTQIFNEEGKLVPVTLLRIGETIVMQEKTADKDGVDALVLCAFPRKKCGKNKNKQYKFVQQFTGKIDGAELGKEVKLDGLETGDRIKISSTTKGRGFAGVIKKYNFGRGRETHGSHHHREPGSSGTCAKPGRIMKGKKFPGQYGDAKKTLTTTIVNVDKDLGVIAVKGAVPGAISGFVSLLKN